MDLISERISCHPKKRRERANERKPSANILLSRELDAALSHLVSLFLSSLRQAEIVAQFTKTSGGQWSSQKQEYQEPRFRNRGAGPFQDALNELRVASYFYRYYFSVVHIDVKYSFDILF